MLKHIAEIRKSDETALRGCLAIELWRNRQTLLEVKKQNQLLLEVFRKEYPDLYLRAITEFANLEISIAREMVEQDEEFRKASLEEFDKYADFLADKSIPNNERKSSASWRRVWVGRSLIAWGYRKAEITNEMLMRAKKAQETLVALTQDDS